MNRSRWYSYAKYSAWGTILFNILLLVVGNRDVNFILGIIILIWFFLSSFLAVTLLAFLYQKHQGRWWYWLLLLGVCVLGGVVIQNTQAPANPLRVIGQSFLVFGTWTVGISLSIQLFKHDFSLKLATILTLIWVWICVIIFTQQPSLFDIGLRFIVWGEPWFIWWMGALTLAGMIVLPICIASFLWHTALILWRELFEASPAPRSTSTSDK